MMCTWEARPSGRPGGKIHCKIHGSRSMQEAIWYTTGKPDDAGGHNRIHVHWEAGVGRGPKCVHMGSPTEREAQ